MADPTITASFWPAPYYIDLGGLVHFEATVTFEDPPPASFDYLVEYEDYLGTVWKDWSDTIVTGGECEHEIKISWDGKETIFAPIGAKSTGPARAPTVAKEPKEEEAPTPEKPASVETVRVEAPAPVEDDPLAWLGVKLSPRLRALLLEKWNHASDEEKEQAKEEWNKMSDEEKEKAIESMEQNM